MAYIFNLLRIGKLTLEIADPGTQGAVALAVQSVHQPGPAENLVRILQKDFQKNAVRTGQDQLLIINFQNAFVFI